MTAVAIEQDVLPYVGSELVPDDLLRRLGKCLQIGSKLYDLNLPEAHDSFAYLTSPPLTPRVLEDGQSDQIDVGIDDHDEIETRFDADFDRQATGKDLRGTTADIVEVERERFAYWWLDLLFLMCSDEARGRSEVVRVICTIADGRHLGRP